MLAKKGEWDGTVGWHKNAKREKIFYISNPLFYDISAVFHLKRKPIKFKKLKDLKGLRAGLIMGYEYKVIDPLVKKGIVKASYVPREELAFKMLLNERFDFFPLSLDVGNAILQSKFTKKERDLIEHLVVPNKAPFTLYMLYKNERSKVLIKGFNKGLKKWRI
ncbi:MAG: ABC transporter substrate-binding protein [Desulfobacterales bacterium]|nr:ABC transporter substrate-binding protein [Desulfobacterales bacterium]MCP4159078.1 ABC transporter substrate-binding protein [Deltaproteobacteria bacterium]